VVLAGLRHSPFDPIHIIDVLAFDWIQRLGGPALADRFQMHPDPLEPIPPIPQQQARKRLGLPTDGRYICCPGVLHARKGISLLLEAFTHADLRHDDRLLLVGLADEETRAFLRREATTRLLHDGRIQLIDRYVNGEEFSCAFRAADVIACPYPYQPHPSSIAVKAMAAERPVLGADGFWIGHMVPLFEMGWTVKVSDREAFGRAMRASLEHASGWRRSEASRRLIEFNSADAFKAMWTVALRRKMGLPPPPAQRSWQWVVEALTPAAQRRNPVGVGS
jgi:glycosyltransferase involved in cell wall biosynthesis